MKHWWFARLAKFILILAAGLLILSLVVMALWNALIPEIFKGPEITYWQAAGLLLLSHILLRGWGRWRYGNGWRHDRWRSRFAEKLASMTPEDREKFREEWRKRCGWSPGEPEHDASAKG